MLQEKMTALYLTKLFYKVKLLQGILLVQVIAWLGAQFEKKYLWVSFSETSKIIRINIDEKLMQCQKMVILYRKRVIHCQLALPFLRFVNLNL